MSRYLRIAGFLALLALPLLAVQLPPVRAALLAVVLAMRSGGAAGVAIYTAAYAAGGVVLAPVALLSGMAGYAYGPVRGVLIASPACLIAACTAFLVGRFALRGFLSRRLGGSPQLATIARAVEMDGLRITLLLRLTPITPQNFLSYVLSLTRLRARDFALATWLGLLPMTCFQVYVGSLVRDAAELFSGTQALPGPWALIAPAAGLVVSAVLVVVLSRFAKRALSRAMAEHGGPSASEARP